MAPQTYSVHNVWVVLYIIGSLLMIGAVLISLALRFTCRGPDILGSACSIPRYSGALGPQVNSAMDGSDVTQYYGDRVIVPVKQDSDRGKTIVPSGEGGRPAHWSSF